MMIPHGDRRRALVLIQPVAAAAVLVLLVASRVDANLGDLLFEYRPQSDTGVPNSTTIGADLAIDGDIAIIGDAFDSENGLFAGAAYVVNVRTGDELRKLTPNDGPTVDLFGSSVAIDAGTTLVGAPSARVGGASLAGAAYTFDTRTGRQLAKLSADDATAGDNLGNTVALEAGIAIVGSPFRDEPGEIRGAAYAFDAVTGDQLLRFDPQASEPTEIFGLSVAIADGVAAIGSPSRFDTGATAGSVYLFDAFTGDQLLKVTPENGEPQDYFGGAIAMDDGLLVVGAEFRGGSSLQTRQTGAAYVFDTNTGEQLSTLIADDTDAFDRFGSSVSIAEGMVLVGAVTADTDGVEAGAAYLFNARTGEQLTRLAVDGGARNERFGQATALSPNLAVVGASRPTGNAMQSGSVYVYSTVPEPTAACVLLSIIGLSAATSSPRRR